MGFQSWYHGRSTSSEWATKFVNLFTSLIVGVFGGYWIKFLRWKELDDLDGYSDVEYQRYSIRCLGQMFSKVQDVCTTFKYVVIMMIPRIIEGAIVFICWSYAFGSDMAVIDAVNQTPGLRLLNQ